MKEGSVHRGTQPSKELISIPCIHTTWCKHGNFHNPIHFLTGSENFINTVRCPHRSNSFPWLLLGNIHISSNFEVQVNCPRVHEWSHFPIRHRDAADQNQLLFCLKNTLLSESFSPFSQPWWATRERTPTSVTNSRQQLKRIPTTEEFPLCLDASYHQREVPFEIGHWKCLRYNVKADKSRCC